LTEKEKKQFQQKKAHYRSSIVQILKAFSRWREAVSRAKKTIKIAQDKALR